MKKIILVVTDSLGVGELPDAEKYGDKGADTLGHIVEKCGGLKIPNLINLGIGNIDGVCGGRLAAAEPVGCFGKMAELSKGKDTTTGHWELAGLRTDVPFKTYPDGFPREFMEEFEKKFDYITLIGVLEYAPLYTNSDNSFHDFLTYIKSLLKEDGKLGL